LRQLPAAPQHPPDAVGQVGGRFRHRKNAGTPAGAHRLDPNVHAGHSGEPADEDSTEPVRREWCRRVPGGETMKMSKAVLSVLLLTAGLVSLGTGTASATDGCVTTKVTYAPSGWVQRVTVANTCGYSLFNVDSHVFDGSFDKRSAGVAELKPNHYFTFRYSFRSSGLTCGEIWTPPNKLWGRDCHYQI
jgi:hypothetical protein